MAAEKFGNYILLLCNTCFKKSSYVFLTLIAVSAK